MTQACRLKSGGRIDRSQPIDVYFNGTRLEAYAGDTMASALLANGIHLVGRSFKYHRPRGILTHGSAEPNALLQVRRGPGRSDPNNRATILEAVRGLETWSQNHWPSLRHDLGAVGDKLASLLGAGFYYKTFKWPRSFWEKLYEPAIRKAAGLGTAPTEYDADRYVHRYAHCEVLIVGAGPAGLAAALSLCGSGKRVLLVDEQSEPGGTLLHDARSHIGGDPAAEWLRESLTTLRAAPNVSIVPRATAYGYYNHNYVCVAERVTDHLADASAQLPRERLWHIRAQQVVLATGAHERPLIFGNNDRPAILLAESIRVFINRYGVLPGRNVVIVTNGASAYEAAIDAALAGANVTLVDHRQESEGGPEIEAARSQGVRLMQGYIPIEAHGRARVSGVTVARVGEAGTRKLECDLLGMSGGWTPAVHLFSQSRGTLTFDDSISAFVPGRSEQAERSVGAARGLYDLQACLEDGWGIGASPAPARFAANTAFHGFASATRSAIHTGKARAFIDFQNDVTEKDIRLAAQEGFDSAEHMKRYTTTGMGTDQGKSSNMNALAVLARTLDRRVPELGTTTFRPPYTPVSFGALAGSSRGALFAPVRKAPMHEWAAERGARFEIVGPWLRAHYFARSTEDQNAAVNRECLAVRAGSGLFDASTLGKIEVVGPDATEFLNRMYVNSFSRLAVGRCRYGLMLKEDGYVLDDGVVARIRPDCFHVTTTTGGAARVFAHMEEYLQTEWPQLRVYLTSITEQWAVIALQGPRARQVLQPLLPDIDLSPASFPHLSVRSGHILGVPMRLFRMSFTGEMGYEINVPARSARKIWEVLYTSGERNGITAYGTEAMHVLRAERGFIIVGQETDGTVTPGDLGLERMIDTTKPDFVGKRSLARPDLLAADRKVLVGLLTESPQVVLEEGAQVLTTPGSGGPRNASAGHVTSSYWSSVCSRSIALALVKRGRHLKGQTVEVTTPSGFTRAVVTDPVFFDPTGERLHA